MKIAVLALQGAFIEHINILNKLGIETIEIRQKKDALLDYDGLILPGGESTVQGKLLKELGIFDILKDKIINGLPVLATCAGMILLSQKLSNDNNVYLGTLPITVKRNAYGRQLSSFHYDGDIKGIGNFPMEFIRAPYVEDVSDDVDILAKVNNNIVAVKYINQIALSFHPELTSNTKIHEYFINTILPKVLFY